MPWGRHCIGRTNHQGLVHTLYEWCKDNRLFWETPCFFIWGNRDNTNARLRPPLTRSPVITCLRCVSHESKIPA